jgi:MerR family copper efflux transcriptional regulator
MNTTVTAMTAEQTEFAAGAARLGLTAHEAEELLGLRATGNCAEVQERMSELVTARLTLVQAQLDGALAEQAAAGGVGGGADVEPLTRSIPLAKGAGRLQAAAHILAEPPTSSACTDDCACTRAAAVTSGPFAFGTTAPVTAQGQPIVCTLDAAGGDMTARIADWQTILGQATGRQNTDDGIAVLFDHDIARTAELARLLASEYSCCSFATYRLSIDARGVRMEISAPPEARDAYTALFGT